MAAEFDVFLSHSSVDKPWVIKLKDDLQRYGVSVWLDKDEIRPGDLFAEALESGLDNSRSMAIIVSPESIRSGWVKEEYYRALSLEKNRGSSVQIIPVLLRDADLPGFLNSRNRVDFRDESNYAQKVLDLVWGITGEKTTQLLELSAPPPSTLLIDEFFDSLEHDIYVSYADADNELRLGWEEGWISMFNRDFETRLKELLGETPRILRRRKPSNGDQVDETILKQLPHTAILISVLSPSYVKSKACLKEIAQFQRAAEHYGLLKIDDAPRIFPLVKTFIDQPPPGALGGRRYEFFEIDPEDNRPREFYPKIRNDDKDKYLRKFDDLTLDVKKVLTMVKDRQRGTRAITKTDSAFVYLAETTSDLNQERDKIERHLKAHGYTVLPDRPLPLRDPALESVIQAMLERCEMSIHLVGQSYGIVPEATTNSLTELQNKLAAEHRQKSDFCRLIWSPADLEVNAIEDERQRDFITALQTDPAVQQGADLLQNSIEDLKTEILDKIKFVLEKNQQPETAVTSGETPIRIYLIFDPQDKEDAKPLGDYLYDQGFELLEIAPDNGRAEEVRQLHYDNLGICDAVLIYHGHTSQIWLQKKLNDLRKVAGYGRTTPMLAKAIYIGGPENQQKADFRTLEFEVITNFTRFSPQTLAPFLTRIEAQNNGSRQ